MRHTTFALAALTASILTACGGGGASTGDQSIKTKFSAQVSFGDSLSDVGTYAVGTVQALGGGHFTINGNNTASNPALTGKNWTELTAVQFGVAAPCPAQTGLDGDASKGFSVPVAVHAGCYGYAQGGARVTDPVGPGNKLTGSPLGSLTVPVVTQIKNHLAAVGGKFKGDEMVLVMAGGNDVLAQLDILSSAATAAGQAAGQAEGARVGGLTFADKLSTALAANAPDPVAAKQAVLVAIGTENARVGHTDATVVGAAVTAAATQPGNSAVGAPAVYGPLVVQAQADATAAGTAAGATAGAKAGADYAAAHGPELVAALGQAGAELVALVKTQIVANGANYVTVNNLPDVAATPSSLSQPAATRALIAAMVKAFNDQLSSGLAGEAKVLLVDVYSTSHDQGVNPGPYGLTNVTDTACDLSPAKNPLASSLVCTASNLKAGDVSHYAYADGVHPTPFNNLLLARFVAEKLVVKGWL